MEYLFRSFYNNVIIFNESSIKYFKKQIYRQMSYCQINVFITENLNIIIYLR